MKLKKKKETASHRCHHVNGIGKRHFSALLCITWLLYGAISASAKDITLKVSSDRQQVYLGESFNLKIESDGSSKAGQIDLSALKDCSITFLGSINNSRSGISIINGRIHRESYAGRSYTYRITPEKKGVLHAGPVILTVDNKTYSADGPSINVSGVEDQDFVIINITPTKDKVLVDEPFEISVTLAIKRLRGNNSQYDPISPDHPPLLEIPFMKGEMQGLEGVELKPFLESLLISNPNQAGFNINGIELRDNWGFSLFEDFGKTKQAKFALSRTIESRNSTPYFVYSIKLKYTPTEEGSHTFGPVIFKGSVITDVDAGGNASGKRVFAVGPAATVRVVPPPEEGRPSSYIGIVGTNITVKSSLDAQTCNLGDPLKLSVSISGDARLSNMTPPNISEQAKLSELLRIYDNSIGTETSDNSKTYTYTVRPKKSGTIELPPIEISYYDTKSMSYKAERTMPIPLRVNEATEIMQDFIIDAGTNNTANNGKQTPTAAPVPAPIDISGDGTSTSQLGPDTLQTLLLIGSPAIYLLITGLLVLTKRRKSGFKEKLRVQSMNKAISILKEAKTYAKTDEAKSSEMLCIALKKYLSQYFRRPEEGFTPSDARRLLHELNLPDSDSKVLCDIFERHFNISYDDTSSDLSMIQTDLEIVEKITNELKRS